ncbi:hypothetical protein [Sulfurospirillum arcachonense]|uniref:hypothetical protein n=1 Tax=Sulfurospirillum arcachonense TaxID=57666 RepID=UPI00046A2AEC|nr:hypothetical protein [Sulfurospirillum arcachonense]
MNKKSKVVLKNSEIFGNYNYLEQSWTVPSWVAKNEDFIEVLKDTISYNITDQDYRQPSSFEELFAYLRGKNYAVFDERFVVCLSQGRLSYLTNVGFSKVSATEDIFDLKNWRIR